MNLMPDTTFFFQLGIFLFFLVSFNFVLFRPLFRLLDKRREFTSGSQEDASDLNAKAETLLLECTGRIEKAKQAGIALKEKVRKETELEVMQILSETKKNTTSQLEEARNTLKQDKEGYRQRFLQEAAQLSNKVVQRVLN